MHKIVQECPPYLYEIPADEFELHRQVEYQIMHNSFSRDVTWAQTLFS